MLGGSVMVSCYFSEMHSTIVSRLEVNLLANAFFDGRWLPAFLFEIGTNGKLPVTIFLLVYALSLARGARAVRG